MPPNHPPPLPQTPSTLLVHLTSFLTTLIHHLLYLRAIYPPQSFLLTRSTYNFPVRQSRHPSVCAWILSAVSALEDQLAKNTVKDVSIVFFGSTSNTVWERWRVGLGELPSVKLKGSGASKGVGDFQFEREGEGEGEGEAETEQGQNPAAEAEAEAATTTSVPLLHPSALEDLNANFRALLSRLSSTSSRLSPLPSTPEDEATFTIAIELKPSADRPVGIITDREERKWIASEPDPDPTESVRESSSSDDNGGDNNNNHKSHLSDDSSSSSSKRRKAPTKSKPTKPPNKTTTTTEDKVTPIRRLTSSELRLEVWVEEGKGKFDGIRKIHTDTDYNDETNEVKGRGRG